MDEKTKKIFFWLFLILVLLFLTELFNNNPTPPDKIDAYIMMKEFVKDKLKSPASADFESNQTIGYKFENGIFTFSGYVDSQNSFGAMLRTRFTVSINYKFETKKWFLESIVFNN
jgi:regulatory protein YycI of two-component signal transduction system YycFG